MLCLSYVVVVNNGNDLSLGEISPNPHIFFTHSSMGGQLAWFYNLAMLNSAVINKMHVDLDFFGYIRRNSTGESHSKSTFIFLKYLCTNFHYSWNDLNQLYKNVHLSIFSPTFGSVLLVTAFLIGVRCKFDAILINISLKN